jgi:flagellar assembly protein FliH
MMSSSKARRAAPAPGAAKSSPYTRFIPREEIGSFAAWEPHDLSGRARDAAPEPTAAEAAALQAEQLKAARTAGYQDGYRDGLVALEAFKQSFARQATSQVGALLESIGAQLDGLQQEMAQSLVATALAVARQVVRSELAQRPDAVARVAQEALETLLLSARHVTLRVHPDDQPLVADGAAEVLEARGARLVADAAIERGGCIVESSIGVVDASVETRWRRAAASIGLDTPWAGDAKGDAAP